MTNRYAPKHQAGNKKQHGRAAYRKGCRCDLCRAAEAAYKRAYRAARHGCVK